MFILNLFFHYQNTKNSIGVDLPLWGVLYSWPLHETSVAVRKKRPWCFFWRIQLDFSKRGTIDSSSFSISAAIEDFCKGQEYKTPHMVNQHQVCFLYFDSERAGLELTMVFH